MFVRGLRIPTKKIAHSELKKLFLRARNRFQLERAELGSTLFRFNDLSGGIRQSDMAILSVENYRFQFGMNYRGSPESAGMQKRTVLQHFRRVWAFISRILLTSRSQIPTCLASCSLGARSQSNVELSHNLFKLITFVIDFKSAETRNSASLLCLRFTS